MTAEVEEKTAEEVVEEIVPESKEQPEGEVQEELQEKKAEFVPLAAHVAERKKRQEAEDRFRLLEQQMMQAQTQKEVPPEDEDDLLTVGKQKKTLGELKRAILEEAYMEQNPEMIEKIQNELPGLLNNPEYKWLADSIPQATNRLQRAAQVYKIINGNAVKKETKAPIDRSQTPRATQSVAKTSKLSKADSIMRMSDQELEEYRVSLKNKAR